MAVMPATTSTGRPTGHQYEINDSRALYEWLNGGQPLPRPTPLAGELESGTTRNVSATPHSTTSTTAEAASVHRRSSVASSASVTDV